MKLIAITRDTPLAKQLALLQKTHKLKKIGIEKADLTLAEYELLAKLSCTFLSADTHQLRISKNAAELASIQKACTLTEQAYMHILSTIRPGMTEKHIEQEIRRFYIQHGAQEAFRSIVAFGSHASVPHHLATDTELKKKDVVLVDLGAKVDGYCADLTRTFFMGTPTLQQKNIYNAVLETQLQAQEYIQASLQRKKPIIAGDVDNKARSYIEKKAYPPFPHALGHGIGMQVHEYPTLSPHSTAVMTTGMVFTLEPGIYIPGKIGVRIEDDYVIKNGMLLSLTHTSKELTIL